MLQIPASEQGECVVCLLGIAAGIMKWASDKAKKKVEEEPDEETVTENDVEVITRKDFDRLVKQIEANSENIIKARNSFEDTLACISIINILLIIIGSDRRKMLLKQAEEQVFTFMRHSDFPSRQMITTMLETFLKDMNDKIEQQNKGERRNVDTRPNNE